jgi:hypothetical protein
LLRIRLPALVARRNRGFCRPAQAARLDNAILILESAALGMMNALIFKHSGRLAPAIA